MADHTEARSAGQLAGRSLELLAGRALALLALTLGLLALAASAAHASSEAGAEEAFVREINAERRAEGLGALAVDVQLTRVARAWTAQMRAADDLSHNPELGGQVQGRWTRLGENVGYSRSTERSTEEFVQRLHEAFMESPGHRRNVLGDYNRVGVGVLETASAMWVTVNFSKTPEPAHPGQVRAAVALSQRMFEADGAEAAVIATADVFADALGGASLAGADAPVLFTPGPRGHDPAPVLHPAVRAEIGRVLAPADRIYLLGGEAAISARVAEELRAAGYEVRRLAGADRVQTALAVAEEVVRRGDGTDEALIVRADDWADAVTGGAYAAATGTPVLLTSRDALHPAVAAFLREHDIAHRWALGGQAALADAVVAAAGAERVAGPDRHATAVAVAERLWGRTEAAPGDFYVSTPAHGDGWAYALAYAPWSALHRSPQLPVDDAVPASVEAYLDRLGYSVTIQGSVEAPSVVPTPVVQRLRTLVSS